MDSIFDDRERDRVMSFLSHLCGDTPPDVRRLPRTLAVVHAEYLASESEFTLAHRAWASYCAAHPGSTVFGSMDIRGVYKKDPVENRLAHERQECLDRRNSLLGERARLLDARDRVA